MEAAIFDDRACLLGEGALFHPLRRQLFWFDILSRKLLSRRDGEALEWTFDEIVSAAGWIDGEHLLIAGQTALWRFSLSSGESVPVARVEMAEGQRPNDGRADPWGGFWFSTMKTDAVPGAILRFYRGAVTTLFTGVATPNAICFSPDRRFGYFADSDEKIVRRVRLDAGTGEPVGAAEIWLDLSAGGLTPDGAVTDAEGNLWVAQWGAGRVAVYGADGELVKTVGIGAPQATCPAFGGADFSTLYCTSAREGMGADEIEAHPGSGKVFMAQGVGRGRAEPAVIV